VTPKLRRFLRELRPLARDAPPDAARPVAARARGRRGQRPHRPHAGPDPAARHRGRDVRANGKDRRGAFPETVDALKTSTPELNYARPYVVDLTGWFDDFGHSGLYDALGGKSRVGTYVNAFANVAGVVKPIPLPLRNDVGANVTARGQRNRCPGAAERPAPTRSNPWKPTEDHNCDPSQILPGGPR
jgi:hypothetical protein